MVSAYLEKDALRPEDAVTGNLGRAFKVDCWTRLDRFLILGAEGNTLYATQPDILKSNTDALNDCLREDPRRAIDRIVAISVENRAPKNEPALFALAKAASHPDVAVRRLALTDTLGYHPLIKVARIGTHLLHFLAYVMAQPATEPRDPRNKQHDGSPLTREQIQNPKRGTGRLLREAIQEWFSQMSVDDLAFQCVKYQSRDGWSMRDALRMAHINPSSDLSRRALYFWLDKGISPENLEDRSVPLIVRGFERAKTTEEPLQIVHLIETNRLPREAIPTQFLNFPQVWEALLYEGRGMPITAMIRNLAKMTSVGLIQTGSRAERFVIDRLGTEGLLKAGRVHPITLLAALKVYEQGKGEKGSLKWTPAKKIVNALDEAFYLAFKAIEPTNQRIRLAVDVSGSMVSAKVNGMPFLDARTAAAAMALVTAATEPNVDLVAFSDEMVPLPIRPSMRLDEVIRVMEQVPFGWTYCRLPIEDALRQGLSFDAFVTYTDSETGETGQHSGLTRQYYNSAGVGAGMLNKNRVGSFLYRTTNETLLAYREKSGIAARHAVVAFSANEISLAHPDDPLQIDFVGLDASGPALLSDFIAGRL